jgi:hypothetical protein
VWLVFVFHKGRRMLESPTTAPNAPPHLTHREHHKAALPSIVVPSRESPLPILVKKEKEL